MHTPTIVIQVMQCCLPLMHAARWRVLHEVAVSAVNGQALSLVALVLGAPRETCVRHRVKCVDRCSATITLKTSGADTVSARAISYFWVRGRPQRGVYRRLFAASIRPRRFGNDSRVYAQGVAFGCVRSASAIEALGQRRAYPKGCDVRGRCWVTDEKPSPTTYFQRAVYPVGKGLHLDFGDRPGFTHLR